MKGEYCHLMRNVAPTPVYPRNVAPTPVYPRNVAPTPVYLRNVAPTPVYPRNVAVRSATSLGDMIVRLEHFVIE